MGLLVGGSVVDVANIIEVFPSMVFYMSDSSRIERPQVMNTEIGSAQIKDISQNLEKQRSLCSPSSDYAPMSPIRLRDDDKTGHNRSSGRI